jgi:hypothetical protein
MSGDRSEQPPLRSLRFGAVSAGAVSLLFASFIFVVPPSALFLLWPLVLFVVPFALVPIVQYMVTGRPGIYAWGWVVCVLIALSSVSVATVGTASLVLLAVYLGVVVAPAIGLEIARIRRWSEGRWVSFSVACGLMVCVAAVAFWAFPQTPMQACLEYERSELAPTLEELQLVASGNPQAGYFLEQAWSWALPSVPLAYLVLVVFWIRPRLVVLGFPLAVGPFERYSSEVWLPAGFALAGAGTLLASGTIKWLFVNLLVTTLILYFVHGLAIIRAHLARWIGRGWLVRWGVALLCLNGPLSVVVIVLGLADSFYPLRPQAKDDGGNR